MRSRSKTAPFAVLAVSLFGAAMATSASAIELPEFNTKGEGAVKFTGTTTEITLETISHITFKCGAGTVTGEVVPPKAVAHVVIKSGSCVHLFTLCTKPFETKPLKGKLVYLSKREDIVALLLEPEVAGEPVMTCQGELKEVLDGSIITRINPVNRSSTSFELPYSQSGGVQAIKRWEGEEVAHNLSLSEGGGPFTESGLGTTLDLKFARAIEVVGL